MEYTCIKIINDCLNLLCTLNQTMNKKSYPQCQESPLKNQTSMNITGNTGREHKF